MHLVVPFAFASSPSAGEALATLELPALSQLLARLDVVARDAGDDLTLSAPHERALAAALGWQASDGLVPMATLQARADGLAPRPGEGWGLLQPTHWHLGTEQVSLLDPAELGLTEADSRTLFDAVRPLFEDDTQGWRLHWGAPTRWYAVHDSLAALPSASADRVIGRNVDGWLQGHPLDRPIRRLQAEVQMLLHRHPLNAAREAQGLAPVNSFWLSGTGAAPQTQTLPTDCQVDERLRRPALAEDWATWREAWQALDAGPIRQCLDTLLAGGPVHLTLAGERAAEHHASQPRPWYRRGWLAPRRADVAARLRTL